MADREVERENSSAQQDSVAEAACDLGPARHSRRERTVDHRDPDVIDDGPVDAALGAQRQEDGTSLLPGVPPETFAELHRQLGAPLAS